MPFAKHLRFAALASLFLSACVAPISVHSTSPARPPGVEKIAVKSTPAELAIASQLEAIRRCIPGLDQDSPAAVAEYNHRVARLVETLDHAALRPWESPVSLPHPQLRKLSSTLPGGLRLSPKNAFIATDAIRFSGEFATFPNVRSGVGATLISYHRTDPHLRPTPNTHLGARTLTAIVRFEGSEARLDFLDPFQTESVRPGTRDLPMAADFIANTCFTLSTTRIDKLGLARLLHPERFDDTAAIQRVQPYDPGRIPVLLIHGLQDTPASFAPMYFHLMADPEIRRHFQFWVFSYPSGYPYPWSGALLRRELDRMKRDYPDHKDIVLIGHSMGGLLSRLMVTDAGDRIWTRTFGKAPSATPLRGPSRKLLEDSLIFHARKDIARAIFICAPHQGSTLASTWIGRTASRLVHLPSFLADSRNAVVGILTADRPGLALDRAPNSIDTLAPENAFIRAIAREPIHPRIPFHSIMGDRGRGDTADSSDGVVAYWSSHLPGAASEKIIPSGHGGHMHPEGIAEVRRILRHHIGLPPPAP